MTRKALIVDDSNAMRQMVAHTLEVAGFDVSQGCNGLEALDELDATGADLIITDLNMPVMDGLSFVREVRTRDAHRFTPILMLTTESHASRKQQGREAGATGWIVKPFDAERLIDVIDRVLP